MSEGSRARARSRLRSLDGLRGVASLVVVLHHGLLVIPAIAIVVMKYSPAPAGLLWMTSTPLHDFWAGGEAVLVFFVLSGFVLTRAAIASRGFMWLAYYPSRLARLYLPVFGAVALSVVIVLAIPRHFDASDGPWLLLHRSPLSISHIVLDATLVAPGASLNSPLWSLRWEVLFSLLLPLYVQLARRVNGAVLIVASIVVSQAGAVLVSHVSGVVSLSALSGLEFMPVFLIGAVMAVRYEQIASWAERRGSRTHLAILIAALLLITLPWDLGSALYDPATIWTYPAVTVGAALLVLSAMVYSPVQTALEVPAVQWLGRLSFSLYLIHEPIIVSVAALLPPAGRWATLIFAIPIALLVAAGFQKVVEGPSHRLSQRIAQAVRQRSAQRLPSDART